MLRTQKENEKLVATNGLGHVLEQELAEQDLSRRGLAEKLEVSNSTVSGWVNGERQMSIAALLGVARVLGKSYTQLLESAKKIAK